MADIFRPTFHAVIPPDAKVIVRGGKRFARFTSKGGRTVEGLILPCGSKCKVETPRYYGRVRSPDGRTRRVALGVTDQAAARQLRAQLQREADQQRAGIIDPFDRHRRTPLIGSMNELPKRRHQRSKFGRIVRHASELAHDDLEAAIAGSHLANFVLHLRSNGRTQRHVEEVTRTIRRVAIACRFEFSSDLDAGVLDRYLVDLIDAGKARRTRNGALKCWRAMTRWMVRCEKLRRDPFAEISSVNEDGDPRRRRRRGLTADEFRRVLEAAERGAVIEGLSGPQRATLYLLAASTGLRRAELADLTLADFSLESNPPFVHVPAASTKAKRDDHPIPLHPSVTKRLRNWLKHRASSKAVTVFDLRTRAGHLRKTSKLMKMDCRAAGIDYRGDLGVADFHGHRVAFVTNLCRTVTDFSTVVSLARHRDPRLTATVYDRINLENRTAAINGLVLPTETGKKVNNATATQSRDATSKARGRKKRTA